MGLTLQFDQVLGRCRQAQQEASALAVAPPNNEKTHEKDGQNNNAANDDANNGTCGRRAARASPRIRLRSKLATREGPNAAR